MPIFVSGPFTVFNPTTLFSLPISTVAWYWFLNMCRVSKKRLSPSRKLSIWSLQKISRWDHCIYSSGIRILSMTSTFISPDSWRNTVLCYIAVSHNDWKLPNVFFLFGWNLHWKRSRFSHLDRLHFMVKKWKIKRQNYWPFSSNNIYLRKSQKAWREKDTEDEHANYGRIKFGSSPFASKMSVSTNQLH